MTLIRSQVDSMIFQSMKKTVTRLIILIALMTIIDIISYIDYTTAATIKKEEIDKSSIEKIHDKEAQGSDEIPQLVYGSSYENILNKPDLDEYQNLDPMTVAASHYHSGDSKGWLDMGAWTKKKGAFGWYADFPVGKGK